MDKEELRQLMISGSSEVDNPPVTCWIEKYADLERQYKELEEQHITVKEKLRCKEIHFEDLKKKHDEMEVCYQGLEDNLSSLEGQVKENGETIEKLREANRKVREEMLKYKIKSNELEESNKKLSLLNQNYEDSVAFADKEKEDLVNRHRRELQYKQNVIADLNKRLNDTESGKRLALAEENFTYNIKLLQTKIVSLQEEIEARKADSDFFAEKANDIQEEVDRLQIELKQSKELHQLAVRSRNSERDGRIATEHKVRCLERELEEEKRSSEAKLENLRFAIAELNEEKEQWLKESPKKETTVSVETETIENPYCTEVKFGDKEWIYPKLKGDGVKEKVTAFDICLELNVNYDIVPNKNALSMAVLYIEEHFDDMFEAGKNKKQMIKEAFEFKSPTINRSKLDVMSVIRKEHHYDQHNEAFAIIYFDLCKEPDCENQVLATLFIMTKEGEVYEADDDSYCGSMYFVDQNL